MSVAEPLRHEGRMEVHRAGQFLASYTLMILKNPKVFNPEVDDELIRRIKGCALDIYAKSWAANQIRANTNAENRRMRYQKQMEAIMLCDEMHAYIGIAKQVFHLRKRRMKYWSKLIMKVRELHKAWKESDVERYGQP